MEWGFVAWSFGYVDYKCSGKSFRPRVVGLVLRDCVLVDGGIDFSHHARSREMVDFDAVRSDAIEHCSADVVATGCAPLIGRAIECGSEMFKCSYLQQRDVLKVAD
jgi:hypothetical protein